MTRKIQGRILTNQRHMATPPHVSRRGVRLKAPKRQKFNAKRSTQADGATFDSKAEAVRYAELKLLARVGRLHGLTVQPRFLLTVGDVEIGEYRADFRYCQCGSGPVLCENQWRVFGRDVMPGLVVEDVKGVKTPLYKWKKKHVEAQYRFTVTEIGGR